MQRGTTPPFYGPFLLAEKVPTRGAGRGQPIQMNLDPPLRLASSRRSLVLIVVPVVRSGDSPFEFHDAASQGSHDARQAIGEQQKKNHRNDDQLHGARGNESKQTGHHDFSRNGRTFERGWQAVRYRERRLAGLRGGRYARHRRVDARVNAPFDSNLVTQRVKWKTPGVQGK